MCEYAIALYHVPTCIATKSIALDFILNINNNTKSDLHLTGAETFALKYKIIISFHSDNIKTLIEMIRIQTN